MVEDELKMEVREDIRAANMTASIMPLIKRKMAKTESWYNKSMILQQFNELKGIVKCVFFRNKLDT